MSVDVPVWMRHALPGEVGAQAGKFSEVADVVNGAGTKLAAVLAEAGGVLGWQSDGALEARKHMSRADGQVGVFRDLLDRAAAALRPLEAAIAEHQPELDRLMRLGDASTGEDRTGPGIDKEAERKILAHAGAMALADRTARAALLEVIGELRALGATNLEDDWVGSSVPGEVGNLLSRYGVTESAAERALLDKIMFLPSGARGDAELREMLAAMTPAELADFLLRHPDVARRLSGGLSPSSVQAPGSPEARLAEALDRAKRLPPKERIAAIRAAFASMTPEERQRLALLYPEVVGNLDGAPLDARMTANRVKIGVALDDERLKQVEVRKPDADRGGGEAARDNQKRLDFYGKLLYEELPNPTYKPGSGRPKDLPHQILFFDNAGDGRIAEMWGTLDANTQNVGVFVPGTTADMENFSSDSAKMRDVARSDPSHDTVTIAWLGTDMPDEIANAPLNHYAEKGGPRLRDFVWGLDVPSEKRVTAIGHSYGGAVVGVAEREGLEVDNVLHIASAGAGRGVDSVDDYPSGRNTKRYSMTAPGDFIENFQGLHVDGVGHGADPDTMDGVMRLETGRYDVNDPAHKGEMIQGRHAHSEVTRARGSTAWQNIVGVVTGGSVVAYTPPFVANPESTEPVLSYPYADPGFQGPVVDIE